MDSLEPNKEQKNVPEEMLVDAPAMSETPTPAEDGETSATTVENAVADSPVAEGQPSREESGEQVAVQGESASSTYAALSREELVETLRGLVNREVSEVKDEVEQVKQWFYKKLRAEHEEQKRAFMETEGAVEDEFRVERDALEDTLKTLLGDFKAKKATYLARLEQEKENNLLQKQHVLEQMKTLTEATDDVAAHIGEFKDLQQKWKTIGAVPATASTDLWKQYNVLQERFWDLIKINNELREYDFKKNLEAKLQLCAAAEELLNEEDVPAASRRLQKLHEEWREIGPVAREMREELWSRFKEATAEINRKHQSHFDAIRQGEEENLTQKEALCSRLEAIDLVALKTYVSWDEATQTVKDIQEEWRKIGFAPRKANQAVYDRYRGLCDAFFDAKATFYKEAKAEQADNLERKRALCEQAEALKESTDWRATTDKLVKLQKEWKEVGPVQKKYSDELWKRFIAACDYFFEQKNRNTSSQRQEELEHLKAKQDIIARIDALDTADAEQANRELKALMEEYKQVGHVPFRDKDKVFKAYRAAVDKQFAALNIHANNRRMESFRANLEDMSSKGEQKLYREREKLVRACEHLRSEIATYENNMGFFSATSKKADGILKEMERKIDGLKEECRLMEEKIRLIEDKL